MIESDKRMTSAPRKKRKQQKTVRSQGHAMRPPLSVEAEAAFYALEEEHGVYDWFWRDMGYYVEHGVDYPPYPATKSEHHRLNNRARGWNGLFVFTFVLRVADAQVQHTIFHTLRNDYQCELSEGEMVGQWVAQVRTNGKRVKNLTRMLNRQYARGYLVWKEI